ncbi:MAG: four helix bundle protein [Ignavibacteria bacterium RBG_16_34_14]|nr:MAG: four helix bundle protein [Ignavibacteria bacterium RBG_16_34_14]
MKAASFEDLKVWQDAREFVKSIYELTSSDNFRKDFGLKDQIQRAAVSIMNNIAVPPRRDERNNNKEFIKFLKYSKGSAGEVRSMLYVALDLDYISKNSFNINYELSIKIITQISNFIKYLRRYAIKGKLTKASSFIILFFQFFNL